MDQLVSLTAFPFTNYRARRNRLRFCISAWLFNLEIVESRVLSIVATTAVSLTNTGASNRNKQWNSARVFLFLLRRWSWIDS